ncbi:hypothetical protein CcCBS67573_g08318 [Chytriomyces confervae]|uniref:ABC1 atypical kinase-like domain-containing protein n=1 Tax=Chytriomyces confervae TaxID=246404 RepID=A0A507ELV3_9FUNG|nr:hypothetical protein CcCBS67573_g08318 [Chytriomyces confervae]
MGVGGAGGISSVAKGRSVGGMGGLHVHSRRRAFSCTPASYAYAHISRSRMATAAPTLRFHSRAQSLAQPQPQSHSYSHSQSRSSQWSSKSVIATVSVVGAGVAAASLALASDSLNSNSNPETDSSVGAKETAGSSEAKDSNSDIVSKIMVWLKSLTSPSTPDPHSSNDRTLAQDPKSPQPNTESEKERDEQVAVCKDVGTVSRFSHSSYTLVSLFARISSTAALLTRVFTLALVFLPVLAAMPLFVYLNSRLHLRLRALLTSANDSNDSTTAKRSPSIKALWFITLLAWSLQQAGPAFIKLAQYASSREDLFSYEVCQILGRLQDRGNPHSMFWTRRAFQKENVEILKQAIEAKIVQPAPIETPSANTISPSPTFQDSSVLQLISKRSPRVKFDDLFEEFDERPVGVGAIAQVYKARLKSNKQQVAVKILHPNVVSLIQTDLVILESGATLLTRMFPNTLQWLSLRDEVAVFSDMMRAQTDLRTEASNLSTFQENFKGWAAAGAFGSSLIPSILKSASSYDVDSAAGGKVVFPKPYLCSPSILVEEYIDAVPVSRFLSVRRQSDIAPAAASIQNVDASENESEDDLVVVPLAESSRIRSGGDLLGTVFDVQIAKIGMQSFVKMLLVDNFCHADLHPGNIIISFTRDEKHGGDKHIAGKNDDERRKCRDQDLLRYLPPGVKTLADLNHVDDAVFLKTMATLKREGFVPELVYLDAGLVSTLSDQNLINLNDLLMKIVQFDGPGVAKLLVERQRIKDAATGNLVPGNPTSNSEFGNVIDFDGFSEKMKVLLTRIRDSSLKLSTVSFSWILRQVFGMVRTHHVRLEGDFANVGVAVMLVEGVGRRLDPGVDLLEEVRGVVVGEWALAVGDLWIIRGVLEVYAAAKRIGSELVDWGITFSRK